MKFNTATKQKHLTCNCGSNIMSSILMSSGRLCTMSSFKLR